MQNSASGSQENRELDELRAELAECQRRCREKTQLLFSEIEARRRAEARVRKLREMLREKGVEVP